MGLIFCYRAGGVDFAFGDVVNEGDVVSRVPVKGVTDSVKVDAVQQDVDRFDHLRLGQIRMVPNKRGKILTSSPLCLAEQLLRLSEPEMKSFWTSITKRTLTGRTI